MKQIILASLLALVSTSAFSQTKLATRCDGCNDQAAKQAAISALVGTSATIYVIDNPAQAVRKYSVNAHNEPGNHTVTALKVATDTWFKDIAEETWYAQSAAKNFSVPPAAAGSAFDFLRNSQNRGAALHSYNLHLNTLFGGLTAAISTGINQVLGAFNMNTPQYIDFDFADGSEIRIHVTLGVEVGTNAVGFINWQFVPNSARLGNLFIPMSGAEFSGFSTGANVSGTVAGQLEALARAWNIPVVSGYGVRGIVCTPDGCTSQTF